MENAYPIAPCLREETFHGWPSRSYNLWGRGICTSEDQKPRPPACWSTDRQLVTEWSLFLEALGTSFFKQLKPGSKSLWKVVKGLNQKSLGIPTLLTVNVTASTSQEKTNLFSESWKTSMIVPIHKQEDTSDPGNYMQANILITHHKWSAREAHLNLRSYVTFYTSLIDKGDSCQVDPLQRQSSLLYMTGMANWIEELRYKLCFLHDLQRHLIPSPHDKLISKSSTLDVLYQLILSHGSLQLPMQQKAAGCCLWC